MKPLVGVWIDHRRAVIVTVSHRGEETKEIASSVEKQPGRIAGAQSTGSFESQRVPADDSRQRRFSAQLDVYYDEVCAAVREAEGVLIFGPGEAKGEFTKRLERAAPDLRVEAVEVADRMTDRQIAARVREFFRAR